MTDTENICWTSMEKLHNTHIKEQNDDLIGGKRYGKS